MLKVVLDVMGADKGIAELINGVNDALSADTALGVVLCGDKEIITPVLTRLKTDMSRIEIIDAKEVITNDDSPTSAFRTKTDSSLVKGLNALKARDDLCGFISAGSTGAVLTAATFLIGRIKGIYRPTLAAQLPTADGKIVSIVDCGANVDSKVEYLPQYAVMGSIYMNSVYGVESPRVALVSVGTEDTKGNEFTKTAFPLLKALPVNFVGNMEARDTLSGNYEVLVCDGFVGNILLKSTEGTAKMMGGQVRSAIKSRVWSKLAYALFMRGAFKKLKKTMDYHAMGGAPLLGLEKIVLKCHGSANRVAIKTAILQTLKMTRGGLIQRIKEGAVGDKAE